jgi:cytochrome P450
MVASANLKASQLESVNITSSEFKAKAFDYYARLRLEAPVHPVKLPSGQRIWLVSRYEDVMKVLKDERLVKSKRNVPGEKATHIPWFLSFLRVLERNMLDLDAPDHTRLRDLVHGVFTPRLITRMKERVQDLSEELLWKAKQRGRLELIHDYALPIPMTIICEILGVPEKDRDAFHRYSSAAVASTSGNPLMVLPSMWRFVRLLRRVVAGKRLQPGDDLITALFQAEQAGDKLSEDELLGMVTLLIIAGHETTVNLIGNSVLALLENPEQLDRLRAEPTLMKNALEELARYYSPVEVATERYAKETLEYAGVTIPKGGQVAGVIASANRDERHFENPNKLDLGREGNRHLAFGQGIHYCLGAPLARLEGQIALQTLLEQLPTLRLAVPRETLRWSRGLNIRGLQKLPLEIRKQESSQSSAVLPG